MFSKLDAYLDAFLDMGVPGYDTVIYRNGTCIYRRTKGYSDLENKIPMNGRERYNIYSCSKPITAVAAMQLYEKGLFKLSDKLSDYLPEFEHMTVLRPDGTVTPAENPILVEHIFTMTAGFSYDTASPHLQQAKSETDGNCPTREVMKYLAREPLKFEPGTDWQYSLCIDVLAALVEVLSGERFGDYVKKNIFDPLGMHRSTFMLPEEELDTLCTQYAFTGIPRVARPIDKHIRSYKLGSMYESGGAGGISTVDDYMKFLEALRVGNVILKNETIDLMCEDRLTDLTRRNYWYTNYGYGLGVRSPMAGVSNDFGWGGAAGAYLMIDRANGITAYHAQHTLNSPNSAQRRALAQVITECILGGERARSVDTAGESTLQQYQ